MISANRLWQSDVVQFYLGMPSDIHPPGTIDPKNAVIIGEAEPDSPIALDYRTNPPRVVYFGDVDHQGHWLELAPTYEVLMTKLRS